jgi:PAS domain S-box-containing protein
MKLSTRITLAMVGLATLTAVAVGWLSYSNLEAAILPGAAERVQIHVRLLATELQSYVQGARNDILSFRSAPAMQAIARSRLVGGIDAADGGAQAIWLERIASRYAAELAAKPAYDLFRLVSFEDGRELVRVDRFGRDGAIRIVPNADLQKKGDREYFKAARAAPADEIYVSAVDLTAKNSVIRPARVPILRISAIIQAPDKNPFGIVIINIDMRPILRHLADSAQPGGRIYVVDDRGNYLVHPDATMEFGSDTGRSTNWQADFPALAAEFETGHALASPITDNNGNRFVAGVASVPLAGGPRVGVMEITPAAVVMAPVAAVGRATLFAGLIAVLCAGALAVLLARSLSRPLVQMTQAVEAFPAGPSIEIPMGAGSEIGVLAGAFARMMNEVRNKTRSLEKEVAERRRTEAELERHADSGRLFGAAVQSSNDAIVTMTLAGIVTGWNPAATRLFGWTSTEILGRAIDIIVPDDRRTEVREILANIRDGKSVEHHETVRLSKERRRIEVSLSVSPIKLPTGSVIGACKIARDITESNKAKQALEHEMNARRRMAEVLNNTIASMVDAVLVSDDQANILMANPAAERVMGISAGMASAEWSQKQEIFKSDGITPVPLAERPLMRALRGEAVENFDVVVKRQNNQKPFTLIANGGPIRGGLSGGGGAVVVYRDVTEAWETERQLRQAQKMEAVGQLTGGVAHDFNNILTVITGTIEILSEGVSDRPELEEITRMIDEAARRGSELTRHLLAFSRKQPLQPRETNLNELIVEAGRLLRPTLGEQIEIESMLDESVSPALVDPSQLITALINLALNARDAMPNGGKLILETANVVLDDINAAMSAEVRAGPYVMIAVSDNGSGIPAAILDKIFEPFFTTKEVGKGTGLGLSMVYGFVRQSGGHIKVYSEEGHGTTFKMFLPPASQQAEPSIDETAIQAVRGGQETVLVVEDDSLVRNYVVAQITSLGYRTLAATNAAEALTFIDDHTDIDLLFTDIVMPGAMNGRQLADEAVRRRPALKVLFTSGYTENAIVHHGRLDPGVLLLAKPYRKSDLARMIRIALFGTGESHPSGTFPQRKTA